MGASISVSQEKPVETSKMSVVQVETGQPQPNSAYFKLPRTKCQENEEKDKDKGKSGYGVKSTVTEVVVKPIKKEETQEVSSTSDSELDSEILTESQVDEQPVVQPKAQNKDDFIGLPNAEAKKVAEKVIQKGLKHPHSTFVHATPVRSVVKDKIINKEYMFLESVEKEYRLSDDQLIYEIPLEYCHLRIPKCRTSRSRIDPWRRYGALAKLCEIGGYMPEGSKKSGGRGSRNKSFIRVSKGSAAPPPPKCKPLSTIDEYLGKPIEKNSRG